MSNETRPPISSDAKSIPDGYVQVKRSGVLNGWQWEDGASYRTPEQVALDENAELRKLVRLGRTAVRDLRSSTISQHPWAADDYMKESEKYK